MNQAVLLKLGFDPQQVSLKVQSLPTRDLVNPVCVELELDARLDRKHGIVDYSSEILVSLVISAS